MATHQISRGHSPVRFAAAVLGALVLSGILAGACSRPASAVFGEEKNTTEPKPETNGDASDRKARMEAMRRVATDITVKITDEKEREFDVIPDALFRLQDATRSEFDGTIWGYGKTGRPAALLTLVLQTAGNGTHKWLYELNSLTSRPVEARIPGFPLSWSTRQSGLEMKGIPKAPSGAENEAGRTRQIRELSSRFTGFEMLEKGPNGPFERFELRLLPRPIHRYSDPEKGLIDGAIFLMAHSTNPEIIMVVELVRDGETTVWKSGFARCAFAEVHIELDGLDVWTQPHIRVTSASDPYSMFVRLAQDREYERK
jgi:hypothetical protein